MSRRGKLKARERVVDADLFAALLRRRERLLALAAVFLAAGKRDDLVAGKRDDLVAGKRDDLVAGMLTPANPSGMVVRMACIALAEAINEGDL